MTTIGAKYPKHIIKDMIAVKIKRRVRKRWQQTGASEDKRHLNTHAQQLTLPI